MQVSELLASANNILGLSGTCLTNFDVSSAEWQRDAPLAYLPLMRIETCDDSQAQGVLWGSTYFPATMLILHADPAFLHPDICACIVQHQQQLHISTALCTPRDVLRSRDACR